MTLGTRLWHATWGLFVLSGIIGADVCGYTPAGQFVRALLAECVRVREEER